MFALVVVSGHSRWCGARGARASVVQWLWWPDKAVKEAQIASCWSSSPHICTHSCSHISPPSIVRKGADTSVLFSKFAVLIFLPVDTQVVLHFALKIDI